MSEIKDQNVVNEQKPIEEVNGQTDDEELIKKWGFDDWRQLYKISIKFYRENESKAFHPSYDTRNHFMAFRLQEKYGNFDPSKAKPLGPLDIIGKDRRNSWISLSNTTQLSAQKGFIKLLNDLCPLFEPYVMAIKWDFDEKLKLKREAEELELKQLKELQEKERIELEIKRKQEEELRQLEEQKRAIQEALNRQTYQQFKTYAEQQYPGNIEEQNSLIAQLQEQHYQQYLLQIKEQQSLRTHQSLNNNKSNSFVTNQSSTQMYSTNNSQSNVNTVNQTIQLERQPTPEPDDDQNQENNHLEQTTNSDTDSDDESVGPIAGASMWTRKDIALFKESIRSEGGDGIIKVGHGEIVTVRVPTHKDGTCIFWEFSTDSYDIGFGLLFEWTKNPGNQVSVHISESEDEDEDEEEGDVSVTNDIEKGNSVDSEKESLSPKSGQTQDSTPISVIIPIYRRDSHEEVFAGSHAYPGKGVYLLKFDNSYSLWRSKTLYYRVYYTR